MKLNHFFQAIKDITDIFFDDDYDKQNNTDFQKLTSQEKAMKFYEIMQFDNSKEFRKKLVGAPHFGVQESRIPPNDISKNYKFRPKKLEKIKQNVEQWKLSKALDKTVMKSRPLPLEKASEQMNMLKKPVKIGSFVKNALPSQAIKDEYGLSDLIDEKSSDEELYQTLNKSKSHNLSQEIPGKIMKRANELSLSVQKQESKKIDVFLKSTSKYFARAMKYSVKKK
jgi:type II secretory pathway component GspD/PulD (secretin)